mmetsp:Transcript_6958/g.8436  ORF Transcript_6958/g.8436 Transcript_6958/m.8436 type:complete len:261 (+) Transcript_6958:64-846(+)
MVDTSGTYRPRVVEDDSVSIKSRFKLPPRKGGKPSAEKGFSGVDFSVDIGPVSQASGSAYIEFGETKVIASVFGPRAKTFGRADSTTSVHGSLECQVYYSPFARGADTDESSSHDINRSEEQWLAESLEQSIAATIQFNRFPKSTLDIVVCVLEDNGGVLAAVTTCTSLALVDSGIELFDVVTASTVAQCGEELILDPQKSLLDRSSGTLSIAYMPNLKKVTQFEVTGNFSIDKLGRAASLGSSGCSSKHKELFKCFAAS